MVKPYPSARTKGLSRPFNLSDHHLATAKTEGRLHGKIGGDGQVLGRPIPHPCPIVGGIGSPTSLLQGVEEQFGIGVEVDVQVPDDETGGCLMADESSHCPVTTTPRRAADDRRKVEELTREGEGEVTLSFERFGSDEQSHGIPFFRAEPEATTPD